MKGLINKDTKYYKYIYQDWTQPTLASNGIIGGSNMAVALEFGSTDSHYGDAYKCFLPNTNYAGFYCDEWQSYMEVRMYFPNPLRITTITFNNPDTRTNENGAMVGTTLFAGDYIGSRQQTYLSIGKIYGTYTNNEVPDNGYYQYYSIYFKNEGTAYNDRVEIRRIQVSGIERITTEGTPSDYDYMIEGGKSFIIKETINGIDVYKALKSYEKGQYYGN